MTAVCRLESMFTITGRGFVLIVEITKCIIRVGDCIVLPMADGLCRERIAGVEAVSDRGPPRDVVGLLLADLPLQDVPDVKAALRVGQLLDVEAQPSAELPPDIEDALERLGVRGPREAAQSGVPGAVDADARRVVNFFATASEVQRIAMRRRLTLASSDRLLGFAVASAGAAATNRSGESLRDGLLAVALEGGYRDWRDTGFVLATLQDAAHAVGPESEREFEVAASLSTQKVAGLLRAFRLHPILHWITSRLRLRPSPFYRRTERAGVVQYVPSFSPAEVAAMLERIRRAVARSRSDS